MLLPDGEPALLTPHRVSPNSSTFGDSPKQSGVSFVALAVEIIGGNPYTPNLFIFH